MTSDAASAGRCQNGTGTYVRCTAAAFPQLMCECTAVARPAAAWRQSGMKTATKNAPWFNLRPDYARIHQITQSLCSHCTEFTQSLRSIYAAFTQILRSQYADFMQIYAVITQSLRNHYAVCGSHYAFIMITQLESLHSHYAIITQSLRSRDISKVPFE